jgi:hypothetical protein
LALFVDATYKINWSQNACNNILVYIVVQTISFSKAILYNQLLSFKKKKKQNFIPQFAAKQQNKRYLQTNEILIKKKFVSNMEILFIIGTV